MSMIIRVGAGVIFSGLFFYVVSLVGNGKLLLKYSLLWLCLCVVALFSVCFPELIYRISDCIGFISPSNFAFLVAVVLLLTISLSLSIAISRLVTACKNLTQRIAILENENDTLRNQQG